MSSPNNRKMVVDVIHAITKIPKEMLWNATFIGGEEIAKKKMTEKTQRTDLTIKIKSHLQIVLEMNQYNSINIFEKNTNYALSKIVENTTSELYAKVILINIDNFNKFNTKKPILEFKIQDEEGHIETESYKSIHLILENIENSTYNVDKEIKKFKKFLKRHTTVEELESEFSGEEKYMAAIRTVKDLSTNPDFSGYYDIEEAHKWDLKDMHLTGVVEGEEKKPLKLLKNY